MDVVDVSGRFTELCRARSKYIRTEDPTAIVVAFITIFQLFFILLMSSFSTIYIALLFSPSTIILFTLLRAHNLAGFSSIFWLSFKI